MRRVVVALAAGCGFTLLSGVAPVLAHASLESSSPSPSAVLEVSPGEIVLDFSEPVSPVEGSVDLFDERLDVVDIPDSVSTAADRIEVRDLPTLEEGLYLVVWRGLSQDGHIAEGAFTFQVGVGSSSVPAEELLAGATSTRTSPSGLGALRHAARIATYLGLSAVLGTLAFAAVARVRRVRPIIATGWSMTIVGTAVQFMTQGVAASGRGWSKSIDIGSWSDVASTRLGQGLIVRLVLLALLAVLVIAALRGHRAESMTSNGSFNDRTTTTWWRSSTALIGGGIVVTFAATGHPSASSPALLAGAVDAVHLSAIVLWLGGLMAITFGGAHLDAVRTFSRIASWALPIALVTGVWQAWHLLDGASDITADDWGRSLVIKVVFVVFAVTIAMVARLSVTNAGSTSLRRIVGVEVVAAVAIVGATSFLVSSPPKVTAVSEVVTVTLAQDDIIANATFTPGGVGSNEIHVTVMTPGGTLDPVQSLEIRTTQVGSNVPPVAVDVELLGPNHFLGTVAILNRGSWTFEFLVQVSPSRVVRLSTTIEI